MILESGSNYIKYNNGLQITFSMFTSNSSGAHSASYTYPKQFKTTPIVSATFGGSANTNNFYSYIVDGTQTNTGCNIKTYNGARNYIIAIGQWK